MIQVKPEDRATNALRDLIQRAVEPGRVLDTSDRIAMTNALDELDHRVAWSESQLQLQRSRVRHLEAESASRWWWRATAPLERLLQKSTDNLRERRFKHIDSRRGDA